MVGSGIGGTLLPALAAESTRRTHPHVLLLPFTSRGPGRTVGLAWRSTSARAEEFTLLGDALGPAGR
mgnify:CR=1 FL=1